MPNSAAMASELRTMSAADSSVCSSNASAAAWAKAPPEPIFYPRNGQSASQLEADRQACNRWATTQPSAMADAGVFHRATQACMDAQGYTSR